MKVFVKLDGDVVEEITFEGSGCAISTAAASIMTETIKGKKLDEARVLFEKFHALATGVASDAASAEMGKLRVFAGVSRYPARVKCATLVWHTLQAAVDGRDELVSTE